jgi:hypothetical protein
VRKLGENLRDGLTGHACDTEAAEIGRRILAATEPKESP